MSSTVTATPPVSTARTEAAPSAKQMRRERSRRLLRALGLFVGLPTLVASVYYFALASDQYESVTTFTVQSSEGRAVGGLETLLGTIPGGPADRDVMLARDFVLSRDMYGLLDNKYGYAAHYGDTSVDRLSRLPADADSEERYDYYLDQLELEHDSQSGALNLRVRAFSANDAQRFARGVLSETESMVNRLADRARRDRMEFAERELETAQKRLTEARLKLLQLQGEGAEINPLESAGEALTLRGALKADLARARAELRTKRALMHGDAPEVRQARERVTALQREVARQDQRLVGRQGDSLNASIARFEPAVLEKEFAEHALQSALASLELARVEASRQHRYLVTIAEPSVPSAATHPRPLRRVATVMVVSLVLLGIGALLLGAVREHGKF